jgi:[ribosomal protein S5]-alanine N-acetyltransferase
MKLIPRTRDEVRATLDTLPPEVRAEFSPQWLAPLENSAPKDPWVHGFHVVNDDGVTVGLGAFKGPPADGVVEIAYAIEPEQQGKGHAKAAACALVEFAFASGQVRVVRAHTLPTGIASQRVLLKAGFEKIGEVVDPEDGLVWRYEQQLRTPSHSSQAAAPLISPDKLNSWRYR